jgi:methionine-rich copper-binding protein CopC
MRCLVVLLLLLTLLDMPALGSTKLRSSEPAEGAQVDETARITLHFSGTLRPELSGAILVGPSGKTVPVATAVGVTAITLLPFHLKPGRYHVDWHSVGQDKSKAKGSIAFTVAH